MVEHDAPLSGKAPSGKRTRPALIALDVTSACNLRCLHCYNASGTGCDDLSDEELCRVAEQVADMHPIHVCLCGGEPLMRRNLLDVIDILIPQVGRIAMVSNGLRMDRSMAEALVKHGIYTVQISLDGAYAWQHETIRGHHPAFEQALAALDALAEANMPQRTVSILPTVLNPNDLEAYVQLCLRHGVHIIRSMPFLPFGRGSTAEKLMLNGDAYFRYKRSFLKLRDQYSDRITLDWEDPLELILTMPKKAREGLPCYSVEIHANGDLVPSSYLSLAVGNLKRHKLSEYWFGGYDRIWCDPRVVSAAEKVRNIYDLEKLSSPIYGQEAFAFDLLEDRL